MLPEADMGMTNMAMDGQMRPRQGEHYVRFFHDAVQDMAKTEEEGRPIYEDREFIEIRAPGNQTSVLIKEVNEYYRDMFAMQYHAWKQGDEEQIHGTPLKAWPMITASQVKELQHLGILSVEQLAEVADSSAGAFMGFNTLKRRAKLFLEAAEGNAPMEKMSALLEERDNEIEVLKRNMEEMGKRIDDLMASRGGDQDED
jgi:hypothetical protein